VIVAIDGPAGSGKSTVAKLAAERLGFRYLDTGAMYRAIALRAIERGVAFDDDGGLARIAEEEPIAFEHETGEALPSRTLIGGRDVSAEIRSPEVDRAVSPVSACPAVRTAMVARQREVGAAGDTVLEGRDIGTVVFPDAEVKIYLTASAAERSRRRVAQQREAGIQVDAEEVRSAIEARDAYDSTRAVSPLHAAADAVELDTTGLSIEQVVDEIERIVSARRDGVSP